MSGQKFTENAENSQVWRVFESLKLARSNSVTRQATKPEAANPTICYVLSTIGYLWRLEFLGIFRCSNTNGFEFPAITYGGQNFWGFFVAVTDGFEFPAIAMEARIFGDFSLQ